MVEATDSREQKQGIAGLPKSWSVAVQLIGTFGLAVFLVLYYVFVFQPREAARYDELRNSVEELTKVVKEDLGLLNRAQSSKLEELYILATAPEVADIIFTSLKNDTNAEDIAKKIRESLLMRTDLVSDLKREGGGIISEQLTYKIINSEIARKLADRAVQNWKNKSREDVLAECNHAILSTIKMAARAK